MFSYCFHWHTHTQSCTLLFFSWFIFFFFSASHALRLCLLLSLSLCHSPTGSIFHSESWKPFHRPLVLKYQRLSRQTRWGREEWLLFTADHKKGGDTCNTRTWTCMLLTDGCMCRGTDIYCVLPKCTNVLSTCEAVRNTRTQKTLSVQMHVCSQINPKFFNSLIVEPSSYWL